MAKLILQIGSSLTVGTLIDKSWPWLFPISAYFVQKPTEAIFEGLPEIFQQKTLIYIFKPLGENNMNHYS